MEKTFGDTSLDATGVVRTNSIAYLNCVFSAYQDRRIVVPLSAPNVASDIAGLKLDQIIEPGGGGGWFRKSQPLVFSDEIATVSYTSGTQGVRKGIILTHRNLSHVIQELNSFMRVDSSIREYIGVPIYHSFGFGRVRACLSADGEIYIPQDGFDPAEISRLLGSGEINAISAVPTLWRLILSAPDVISDNGHRAKWIEIGSQPMSREEKEAMKALFPNAVIVQHYGLTEASRTSLLDISSTTGSLLESVGKPLPGSEVRCDSSGRISVKGPHVAERMLSSDGIVSLLDSDGWFVTSDQGNITEDHLYFQGRADEMINIGGIKISPDYIEQSLYKDLSLDGGLGVTRVQDELRGNGILVAYEASAALDLKKLREATIGILRSLGVNAGSSLYFNAVENLPVTDTGKLKRNELRDVFDTESAFNVIDQEAQSDKNCMESILQIVESHLKIDGMKGSDSLLDLGIDSIQTIQLSVAVRQYLGFLPDNWTALTIDGIEAAKLTATNEGSTKTGKLKPLMTLMFAALVLIAGELFLQVRSHVKTGRSALNLLVDNSTFMVNEEFNVKTYRPGLRIESETPGEYRIEVNSLG